MMTKIKSFLIFSKLMQMINKRKEIPKPEFNMDDPNIIQPEPQLINQQPENVVVPVAEELLQPQPNNTRRSTCVHCHKQKYVPSMQDCYQNAAAQLATGVLYPDAHMFVQDKFY